MLAYNKQNVILELASGNNRGLYSVQDIFDDNCFMRPAYRQAITELNGIVSQALEWPQNEEWDDTELYGYGSNIIAFCADRGQGKTSTMLSFGNALSQGLCGEGVAPLVTGCSFSVMDPIDPSMLMKSGHAVEVVLAFLYKAIKEELLKGTINDLDDRAKAGLFSDFQKCFRWIQNSTRDELLDEFETYLQTGDGFSVKKAIYDIVQKYLDFKCARLSYSKSKFNRRQNKSFLVIQLDDTDLQLSKTFEIIEEIRKYLSLPNVIVLMAADIDQLRKLVLKHYYSEMKQALEANICSNEDIRRMAAKYIDKFIPSHQIIQLPSLSTVMETEGCIMLKRQGHGDLFDLQEKVLNLIYNRTGLVFAKPAQGMHQIIPSTLRGLRQLIQLLEDMEDCSSSPGISKSSDDAYFINRIRWTQIREANLTIFKNYFIGDWWASKLLDADSCEMLACLKASNQCNFAKYAYNKLGDFIQQQKINKSDLEAFNFPTLMKAIDTYVANANNTAAERLKFAVNTFFSIQFNLVLCAEQRRSMEKWLQASSAQREKMFVFDLSNLKTFFSLGIFEKEDCCNDEEFYKNGFDVNYDNFIVHIAAHKFLPKWLNYFVKALWLPVRGHSKDDIMFGVLVQDYAALLCCNLDAIQSILNQQTYGDQLINDKGIEDSIDNFSKQLALNNPEKTSNNIKENAAFWCISKSINKILMQFVGNSFAESGNFWGLCNRYFDWLKVDGETPSIGAMASEGPGND